VWPIVRGGLARRGYAKAVYQKLWKEADLGEKRQILLTMLNAVYVDTAKEKAISSCPAVARLLDPIPGGYY
jgi:hypothetical protein